MHINETTMATDNTENNNVNDIPEDESSTDVTPTPTESRTRKKKMAVSSATKDAVVKEPSDDKTQSAEDSIENTAVESADVENPTNENVAVDHIVPDANVNADADKQNDNLLKETVEESKEQATLDQDTPLEQDKPTQQDTTTRQGAIPTSEKVQQMQAALKAEVKTILSNEEQTGNEQKTKRAITIEPKKNTVEYVPVKLTILGKPYKINCPADEEEELQEAGSYIHNFINDIYQQSPHLSQENLLVLCCLNLYEKMIENEKSLAQTKDVNQQANKLIDKIMEELSAN